MDRDRDIAQGLGSASIAELCERFGVRRLDVFGSGKDGRFDPARSDLDFLVSFDGSRGRAYADAYFGLREGLQALFGREIDLVTEAALQNPFLRRSVERGRRQVFPASP